jgi:hypothetical protein
VEQTRAVEAQYMTFMVMDRHFRVQTDLFEHLKDHQKEALQWLLGQFA